MQDYAAFCRQRLLACFHRRRKYPLGSDERQCAVTDARNFLRYYREEIACQEADRIAEALEIAAPVEAIRRVLSYAREHETKSPPLLRCVACGWVHYAAEEDEEALDCCFKCKGLAFEVVELATVTRGVTVLPLRPRATDK